MSRQTNESFVRRYVIKASAGTGKTHNLTSYYLGSLGCEPAGWNESDREKFSIGGQPCRPEEIIAVTFTRKAASELRERFRKALLKEGRFDEAARVDGSLIGTVHSVCLRLLQEYALDAGISPVAEELSEEDGAVLFRRAAAPLMQRYAFINDLFYEFGLDVGKFGKKRKDSSPMLEFCRTLIGMARINGLERSFEQLGVRSCDIILELMDRICPETAGDGEAELRTMREELAGHLLVQTDENRYDWSGSLSKTDKAAGGKRKLSGKEEAHLEFMKSLPSPSTMLWKHWLGLIGREAGKKDETLQIYVEELTALGRRVFGLPQFRNDVRQLVTGIFSFASEAMARFSEAKQNAGVVDFVDMERMAREALLNERVRARLQRRFRVLFVDEFQDTSPIQLSIFRLLGQLIHGTASAPGRIIYVGDDKQSIYGFRGAAPELTRSCTPAPLWEEKPLKECWRSLPELCRFTSGFFSQVEEGMRTALLGAPDPDDPQKPLLDIRSVLETREDRKALRRTLGDIESLRFWITEASEGKVKKSDLLASLARNVAGLCGLLDSEGRLLSSPDILRAARVSRIGKIGDSFTENDLGTRPVRPGDIAVLCRSNKDCVQIADALEELGIPAAAEREGLLEQEDAAFCLDAYRLALAPEDRLAAAELHLAINGGDAWFSAAAKARDEAGSLWEGIPFMDKLETLHKCLAQLTPAELLDETLSAADCFRNAAAKTRPEERFSALETLRSLVREYETAMHSRRCSATAQGWLDWLRENEPGLASGGQDAVQVWTYHKSKGLERKVVILHGLSERKPNIDIFQPWTFSTGEADGGRDPLDDRMLEWIPNIFGKAIHLNEVADFFSDRKGEFEKRRVEESQRLLYVGMTRACDVLVLTASMAKKGITAPWLAPFICEDPDSPQSSGEPALDDISFAEDGTAAVFRDATFRVSRTIDIQPVVRAGSAQKAEAVRFPRAAQNLKHSFNFKTEHTGIIHDWLDVIHGTSIDKGNISPDSPRDQLGNMLHGWFAVWFGMGREQREAERASGRMQKRLERFCALWNEAFSLWSDAAKHLPAMSDALEKAVLGWFDEREDKRPGDELAIRTEWPLEHRLSAEGAFLFDSMRVDLMAEVRRADGSAGPCLIIDHKCGDYERFGNNAEKLADHLTEAYAQRQSDYIRALHAMGRDCRCWLHLPLEGRMLELTLNENEA